MVKGRFRGTVQLVNQMPPESCRLEIQAKGTAGTVSGEANVRLQRLSDAQTLLRYDGEATVRGLVASVGSMLFRGSAKSFTDEFFASLARV